MEGTLCKKAEGGVGVGNIVGKFGGVFEVGLEAVFEERVSKSGGPERLSEEAESCGDFNPSGDWLPVDDGAGDREGVQGFFHRVGNRLAIFLCDAWDGEGAIGGGHDAGLVKVEVATTGLAEAVKFLKEEQDIFYVNGWATLIDIT